MRKRIVTPILVCDHPEPDVRNTHIGLECTKCYSFLTIEQLESDREQCERERQFRAKQDEILAQARKAKAQDRKPDWSYEA